MFKYIPVSIRFTSLPGERTGSGHAIGCPFEASGDIDTLHRLPCGGHVQGQSRTILRNIAATGAYAIQGQVASAALLANRISGLTARSVVTEAAKTVLSSLTVSVMVVAATAGSSVV